MKVIIFGTSGFIGKNLVRGIDNKHAITISSLRDKSNLEKLNSSFVVINLVGKAHDHKGEATERDFYYANYDLVKDLFNAFINSDAKILIHISSIAAIEEFGSSNALTEDMECKPVSWYGQSKRKAEEFLLEQELPKDKKVIILRPTMVHGPGDKGNLILLYKLISKGIPYPLAKFDNKRSFLSIDNFNYIINQILDKQESIESGIYHICDDQAVATSDIINIIGKVTNKPVKNFALPRGLVKVMAKVGDVVPIPLNTKRLGKMTSDLIVSNDKIKRALGIDKLPVSAEEGLERTIRSFASKQ